MDRLGFSLTQLEYVVALMRTGSFSEAAKECLITQPTLSMQIQKFEELLGFPLFDRSKKPLRLTVEGEQLMEPIQAVLAESRRIWEYAQEIRSGELAGHFRLGVIPTVAPYLLPNILSDIQKEMPKVHLEIFEMETKRILEAIENDELDGGIAAIPIQGLKGGVVVEDLFVEPFYVLCHPSHEYSKGKELDRRQLRAHDVWLLEEGHCLRGQILDLCHSRDKLGERRNGSLKVHGGSLQLLAEVIRIRGGYTLIPEMALSALQNYGVIVPFKSPAPARQMGMIFRRKAYLQRHRDRMIKMIRSLWAGRPSLKVKTRVIPVRLGE